MHPDFATSTPQDENPPLKVFGIKTGLALIANGDGGDKFAELRAITFDGRGLTYSVVDLSRAEAKRLCSDLNNLLDS